MVLSAVLYSSKVSPRDFPLSFSLFHTGSTTLPPSADIVLLHARSPDLSCWCIKLYLSSSLLHREYSDFWRQLFNLGTYFPLIPCPWFLSSFQLDVQNIYKHSSSAILFSTATSPTCLLPLSTWIDSFNIWTCWEFDLTTLCGLGILYRAQWSWKSGCTWRWVSSPLGTHQIDILSTLPVEQSLQGPWRCAYST